MRDSKWAVVQEIVELSHEVDDIWLADMAIRDLSHDNSERKLRYLLGEYRRMWEAQQQEQQEQDDRARLDRGR